MTWQIHFVTATIRYAIISNSSTMSDSIVKSADVKFEGQHLAHFGLATQDEVRVVIMKSPSNSFELERLPTNLLKKVLEYLLHLITIIINKSLAEFDVLEYFKKARVRPLIKKPTRDKELLENYLPCLRSLRKWLLHAWKDICVLTSWTRFFNQILPLWHCRSFR